VAENHRLMADGEVVFGAGLANSSNIPLTSRRKLLRGEAIAPADHVGLEAKGNLAALSASTVKKHPNKAARRCAPAPCSGREQQYDFNRRWQCLQKGAGVEGPVQPTFNRPSFRPFLVQRIHGLFGRFGTGAHENHHSRASGAP